MIYRFFSLELDTDHQELMSNNKSVAIPPKALSVLVYLIENRDRMVSKAELLDQFWALQVSEAALQTTISVVRKAVGDHGGSTQCIKTYHSRGFRFVAALEEIEIFSRRKNLESPEPAQRMQEQRWFAVLTVKLKTSASAANELPLQSHIDTFLKTSESKVKAARGRLLHMMLDGFSASFGLDPHIEDGTRLALTCAHQITALKEVYTLQSNGLLVSIGVDNGAAIYADDDDDLEWRLPGEVERASADLAAIAQGGDVLVSKRIIDLLRDEIETERLGEGFRLCLPPKERAGLPARPLKRPTTFVGRGVEMSFLIASLEKSRAESCQAVVLSGPAGIGKSRLVAEFLVGQDGNKVAHHRYFCLPRLSETPLALLRAMCIDLFKDHLDNPLPDPIDAALMTILLNEAARPDPILEGISRHQKQQRILALIKRLMKEICVHQARVLVFEDIHWIDAASRRHLEVLIRGVAHENLMIVLTTRPVDKSPMAEGMLQLAPLGRAESLTLLREIPELAEIDSTIVETLAQRAAGNPFFLEELAFATQSGADPVRGLPDTVQAVVEVRIGELEEALRMVVYMIAVIGQPAAPALMTHLLNQPQSGVQESLERLVNMGFLKESERGFACRHMLLHDTAYAMLVPDERRKLHGKIATYLEDNADVNPVRPEMLAWHFQEAGDAQHAIDYWTKASYSALIRSAHPEAAVFSQHGLALIKGTQAEGSEQEMRLQLSLAQSLMAMKGYGAEDVGKVFRRVHALSKKMQHFKTQARAVVGLWVHTWVRGQLPEALDHAHSILEMGKLSGDPSLLAQGHGGLGEVMTHTGKLTQAMEHLAAGVRVVREGFPDTITAQNATVTCAAYAAWVSAMQGRGGDMQMYYTQSKELSEVFENRFAEAIHLALCSEAFMFAGDVETCLDLATQAVALSREHNFPFWLGTGLVMRGWALGQRGDTETGLADLDQGIVVFERTGAGVQLANWYGLKAETLLRAGRIEDAKSAAKYALSKAERTSDVWFTPRVYAVLSHISKIQKDTIGAEALRAKVIDMAAQEKLATSFITIADMD